jgi:hypothetical protein
MDEVIEREKVLLQRLNESLDSSIENEIHGVSLSGKTIQEVIAELSKSVNMVKLSSLGRLLKGKGIPKAEVKAKGNPCVRYGELYTRYNRIIREFRSFIDDSSKESSFKMLKHDVLFAGSGETITEIGKSAAFVNDIEAYAGSDTLIFRPYDMDGYFLGYLMNSQLVRQQLNKYGTGATVMHIYNSDLAMVKIPKINRSKQEEIGLKMEAFSRNIFKVESKIASSKNLQKSLINQIF